MRVDNTVIPLPRLALFDIIQRYRVLHLDILAVDRAAPGPS